MNKKRVSKKQAKILAKDIKYTVFNTALTTVITKTGDIYFDIPTEDEKSIVNKKEEVIQNYREKVRESIEYLEAEGFIKAQKGSNLSSLEDE